MIMASYSRIPFKIVACENKMKRNVLNMEHLDELIWVIFNSSEIHDMQWVHAFENWEYRKGKLIIIR